MSVKCQWAHVRIQQEERQWDSCCVLQTIFWTELMSKSDLNELRIYDCLVPTCEISVIKLVKSLLGAGRGWWGVVPGRRPLFQLPPQKGLLSVQVPHAVRPAALPVSHTPSSWTSEGHSFLLTRLTSTVSVDYPQIWHKALLIWCDVGGQSFTLTWHLICISLTSGGNFISSGTNLSLEIRLIRICRLKVTATSQDLKKIVHEWQCTKYTGYLFY